MRWARPADRDNVKVPLAMRSSVAGHALTLAMMPHTLPRPVGPSGPARRDEGPSRAPVTLQLPRAVHALNNVLTVILCRTELVREGLAPGSPLVEHTTSIHDAVLRAAELTEQLLADASPMSSHRRFAARAEGPMT